MKDSYKSKNFFPRAIRDFPFEQKKIISSGAQTRKNKNGGVLVGFLFFSVWNFLALRTLLKLAEWNLSLLRSVAVALLVSLWLVVTYSLLNPHTRGDK